MEDFFIFLDIDGTLWDNSNKAKRMIESDELDPQSVEAVNNLIFSLKERNFNPAVVIISKKRIHWRNCEDLLYSYNLTPSVPLYSLPIGKFTRGERISLFLHDAYKGKDIFSGYRDFSFFDNLHKNFASKCYNYVVIDDNRSQLTNIPWSNYIQTNIDNSCLNQSMVDQFLQKLDNDFEEEPENE